MSLFVIWFTAWIWISLFCSLSFLNSRSRRTLWFFSFCRYIIQALRSNFSKFVMKLGKVFGKGSTFPIGIIVTIVGKVLARFNAFGFMVLKERKPTGLLKCVCGTLLGPQGNVLLELASVVSDIHVV